MSKRAVGYVRVSTEEQRTKGGGLQAQRQRVEEYATSHGLDLIDVVQEQASGMVKTGELFSWTHRPRLLDLIERARGGEYDVLIVSTFDRLSRDHPSLVMVQRMLQQQGVEARSAGEDNGDSADAKLLRGIKAELAQYEAALIRGRLQAGKAVASRAGRRVSGRVPYGYRTLGRGKLEPIAEQATVVKQMFTDAKDGRSPARIARDLNESGTPGPKTKRTPKGEPETTELAAWSRQSVWSILQNATYKGVGDGDAQPAIVSVRAWNAAQDALAKHRR